MASKELQEFKKEGERQRRDKISVSRCLGQLADIEDKLDEILSGDGGAVCSNVIGALRLKADISLKLLDKKLPSVKAIDISGEVVHSNRLIIERIEHIDDYEVITAH